MSAPTFIGDNSMTMSKARFEELRLQDEEIECEFCHEKFNLQIGHTTGGGYGVVGLICPHCGKTFGLTRGGA